MTTEERSTKALFALEVQISRNKVRRVLLLAGLHPICETSDAWPKSEHDLLEDLQRERPFLTRLRRVGTGTIKRLRAYYGIEVR